jgi:hypothetical protein
MEAISVVYLAEDQEDGDLILDLMVDLTNMVSYSTELFGVYKQHIYLQIC